MRRNRRAIAGPRSGCARLCTPAGSIPDTPALRSPVASVRPDIVFTRARLAVFVDGCFWHCCPIHGNQPRANTDYWRPKLARNVARDRAVDEALAAAGWSVLRGLGARAAGAAADRVAEALRRL